MKTRMYTPKERKTSRCLESIHGDCLERVGLVIPYEGRAVIDCSIKPKVGDLVHCNNSMITISGFIKQVKEFKGDTVIVGTAYMDESKDFTFEASEIYGVVTEVFCRATKKQVYLRSDT